MGANSCLNVYEYKSIVIEKGKYWMVECFFVLFTLIYIYRNSTIELCVPGIVPFYQDEYHIRHYNG